MVQIRFLATLAGQNTSARWLGLDHEGSAKIVLEVPASELSQIFLLATLGKKLLNVTIEVTE